MAKYGYKKTEKMAAVREPHNYWINRRVWKDDNDVEYIKINGNYVPLNWIYIHGWDVAITW